jgi:hypothetical protein
MTHLSQPFSIAPPTRPKMEQCTRSPFSPHTARVDELRATDEDRLRSASDGGNSDFLHTAVPPAASPPHARPVIGNREGEALPTGGSPSTRKRGGGSEVRRSGRRPATVTMKEAVAAPRPTMGAMLEAATKEAMQTHRMKTQYQIWVSSPLEIA